MHKKSVILEKISAKGANNREYKLDPEKLGKLSKNDEVCKSRFFQLISLVLPLECLQTLAFFQFCCIYDTRMSMHFKFP